MTVRVLSRDRGRSALGFLPPVPDHVLPWLAGELGPDERLAMREIIERGDLIHVDGVTYLVAPVSPRCIDALSAFEAEGEDRANDLEDEPSEDPEPDNHGDSVPDYGDNPEQPQYLHPNDAGLATFGPPLAHPVTGETGWWKRTGGAS